MGDIWIVDLIDVLTEAGVTCRVTDVNRGWETRSRGSGGFPFQPLGIFWHHTASDASPESDLGWMIDGSQDAPVGNMLLDRDAIVWPIAAGASNCAGSGGPWAFSRGTIPEDSGNSQGWQIEAANNGVGERWPQVQIDAYFLINNALAARFGNLVTDLITHQSWAPSRKIDPATADAVEGPWQPGAINSSGTWSRLDIQAEAERRAGPAPTPTPPPGDTDMASTQLLLHDVRAPEPWYKVGPTSMVWVQDGNALAQMKMRVEESAGGTKVSPVDGFLWKQLDHGDDDVISSYGPIEGDLPPNRDRWGRQA